MWARRNDFQEARCFEGVQLAVESVALVDITESMDELVTVPWLVHENGPRREVDAEDSTTATTDEDAAVDDDIVAERLRDLGYAE